MGVGRVGLDVPVEVDMVNRLVYGGVIRSISKCVS